MSRVRRRRKACLHIPCLLRRYTYSLGRALHVGETADHCFCNQTCNLHEEVDEGISKIVDSRHFAEPCGMMESALASGANEEKL